MSQIKYRRIGLFAGPGSGKSTTAALMFAKLKQFTVGNSIQLNVEHISEYIKSWSYEKRAVKPWHQLYVFSKQLNREYTPLAHGVDVIVTDSPLILGCAYAKKYQMPGWENLMALAKEFDNDYPSLNIFLRRGNRAYVKSGRYQDENEARQMDVEIENILIDNDIPYFDLAYDQTDLIFSLIVRELGLDSHVVPKVAMSRAHDVAPAESE